MRYFILYHDARNLDNVDVVDEDFLVNLANHYSGYFSVDIEELTFEEILDQFIVSRILFKIEELLPANYEDVRPNLEELYSKDLYDFDVNF